MKPWTYACGLPAILPAPQSSFIGSGSPLVGLPMPTGDILDLFPAPSLLSSAAVFFFDVHSFIVTSRQSRLSDYWAEALIHKVRDVLSPQEKLVIDAAQIGIHEGHPIRALRDRLIANCQGQRSVGSDVALLLWGASAKHGRLLYAQAGVLVRAGWLESHVVSHPDWYGSRDLGDIIMDWARASGATSEKVLNALSALIRDHFLNRRPRETFVPLTLEAAEWVRAVAGPDARRMLAFFRCLQRIAAWQYKGLVRWRSGWLRGTGKSADAIPGASTYSRELTALLNQHVFRRRVQGHSAGKKAATFELTFLPPRGEYDAGSFARILGLELDTRGAPKR
jgi:hypothetical protein